jgi:predicted nucleic acid-binding protein
VVVVDASVWISVLVASDANHAVSRSWMQRWVDDGKTFVLPLLILPEVAGGASRRTGVPMLGDAAAASILNDPSIARWRHSPRSTPRPFPSAEQTPFIRRWPNVKGSPWLPGMARS